MSNTFNVKHTSSNNYFIINDTINPTLSLSRRKRYIFKVNTILNSDTDPKFVIQTAGINNEEVIYKQERIYRNGLTNNPTDREDMIFNVPYNAPDILYYVSTNFNRDGIINITGDIIFDRSYNVTMNFPVVTGRGRYKINTDQIDIELIRGQIYKFDATTVNLTDRINIIKSDNTVYNDGITNTPYKNPLGIDKGNTIVFDVPNDAPSTLYYAKNGTISRSGTITISNPQPTTPTISGFSIANINFEYNKRFDIDPPTTSPSSGTFTYSSSNDNIIVSNTTTPPSITIIKAGESITVTATQAPSPDGVYGTGFINASFTINKIIPFISGFSITDRTFSSINETFSITPPISDSSGAFTYSSSDNTIATFANINFPTITIKKAGHVVITATQAENDNYNSITIDTTFTIFKATPPIPIFTISDKFYLKNGFFTLNLSSDSPVPFTYTIPIGDQSFATVSTNIITMIKAGGPIRVTATQAANDNYNSITVDTSFNILKASPSITNFTIDNRPFLYTNETFSITPPISDSSGAFTYTIPNVNDKLIADVSNNNIIIFKAGGPITVRATQSASQDGNYNSHSIDTSFNIVKATPTITNFTIPTKTYLKGGSFTIDPSSNSTSAFSYTSSDESIATVTNSRPSTISILKAGHVVITATQSENDNYNSITVDTSFNIVRATPSITNFTIDNRPFSYTNETFSITPPISDSSGAFIYTIPNNNDKLIADVSNNNIIILKAGGPITVRATQAASQDGNYDTNYITTTFKIDKATPTITNFTIPTKTYLKGGSFTIDPSSNSTSAFSYTSFPENIITVTNSRPSTISILKAGHVVITATQAENDNYNSITVDTSFNIVRATPSITNFTIDNRPFSYTNETFSITTPRSDSSGAFIYTIPDDNDKLIADVSNNNIIIFKAGGPVTIRATQAASQDGNYNSHSIDTSFNIVKATPTITNLTIPDRVYLKGDSFTLNPLSDSSGNFTYTTLDASMVTVTNSTPSTISIFKTGHVRISITQTESPDGNYNSRTIDTSFNIVKATPTISGFSIANKTFSYSNESFPITTPQSDSSGNFTYTSLNSNIADVSNNILTIFKAGGPVTIRATQSSSQDGNYNSGFIDTSFNIVKATPTISGFSIADRIFLRRNETFPITTPQSDSSGNFTYTSLNTDIADVSNNILTIKKAGHVRITATQSTSLDGNYNSNSIDTSFNIIKATPTITNFTIPDRIYLKGDSFTLNPLSDSSGNFTYTTLDASMATVTNSTPSTINVLKVGLVRITIAQAESQDGNYTSRSIDTSFNIVRATPTFGDFTIPNRVYLKGDFFALDLSSNSTGTISFTNTSNDTSIVDISNNTVHILKTGIVTITATQEQDDNYNSRSIHTSFNIVKANPTITNLTIPNRIYLKDDSFTLDPSSNSSGNFTYTSSDESIATVTNSTPSTVSILKAGHVRITLAQPASQDGNYNSRSIDTSFNIDKATPTLSNFIITDKNYFNGYNFDIIDPSSNSTGTFSYSSLNTNITIANTNPPTITILEAGHVVVTATQSADDNYNSQSIDTSFNILKISPTITNFTIPDRIYLKGDSFTLDQSSNSTGAFSYTTLDSSMITITNSPSTVNVLKAGHVRINLTQATDVNYTSRSIDTSFNIIKATPIFGEFTITDKEYSNGYTFDITDPSSNSTGTFTYSSLNTNITIANTTPPTITILGAGHVDITATQASDDNYNSRSIDTSFNIFKVFPTITNFSILNQKYSYYGEKIPITDPSSNSIGKFSYTNSSLDTSIVDISGNEITILKSGNVTITATQASDDNYKSDTTVASFIIDPFAPTITNFTIPKQTFSFGHQFPITDPSSNSDGAFSYTLTSNDKIVDISGNQITILKAGEGTIEVTQQPTMNYTLGKSTAPLVIDKLLPTITNFTIPNRYYSPGYSDLPITDPSSNSTGKFNYISLNEDKAIVSGKYIFIKQAGEVTIKATQESSGNYLSNTVSTSFTIHQISPNIRNFTIPTLYYSPGGNFPITDPLSNNNNTFIYTIDNTNIADISNNNIIIKQAGETTITVKQESTINYEFQSVTIVLKINKVSTNITNFTIPINNYLFGNNFDIIQPGTNRDGKFSYISSDDNIAYVYGNTIFIKNAGEVTVTSLQTETDNYTEGRATALLRIPKLYPTITNFTIPTNTYKIGDTIELTDPSSNSDGTFSYSSSNTEVATISDKIITILQEESVVITVTQAATNNYTTGTAIAILTIETPIIPEPPVKKVYLGSLFTDNALVYYKSHILSSVGTGTVRNSKVKSKKI